MPLSLQNIFDSQDYYITKFGLGHPETLSTPILVRFIRELSINDFDYHVKDMLLDLELHLRCIVSALRLLFSHGIRPGTGTLTFQYFNDLYNRMSWWYNFAISENCRMTESEGKQKNYNNEFLVAYARDLISSIRTDRTFTAEVGSRMISAAEILGHAVCFREISLTASSTPRI